MGESMAVLSVVLLIVSLMLTGAGLVLSTVASVLGVLDTL